MPTAAPRRLGAALLLGLALPLYAAGARYLAATDTGVAAHIVHARTLQQHGEGVRANPRLPVAS